MNPLQLKIGAKHDEQTLQVRYALTNDTAVDVFVQHFENTCPEPEPSCYIYHVRPHQVVMWAGTPPLVQSPDYPAPCFYQPPIPWAQRLSPGESLDVVLRLPLPLLEYDIYAERDDGDLLEPVWANVIRFRLDVHPMRRGLRVSEKRGLYWVYGHDPVVLEASTTVDPPFPVHRCDESFHRAGLED